jgi:hypothetical protein
MSENKITLSEIKEQHEKWNKIPGSEKIDSHVHRGILLEMNTLLDKENQDIATDLLIAQGAVTKVRALQSKKSAGKQNKIFRDLVREEAIQYARDGIDESHRRELRKLMKASRKRIISFGIGFLLSILLNCALCYLLYRVMK